MTPTRHHVHPTGGSLRRWLASGLTATWLAAVALMLSSCGPQTASSPGEKLFNSVGCSNCHTLSAANSTGVIGPNLDELKPSLATVKRQVRRGGGGMPSFSDALTRAQIATVARYVQQSTGGSPTGPAKTPDDDN